MKILEWLTSLVTYGAAEAQEAGDAFFDEDESDEADEPDEPEYEEEPEDVDDEDEDTEEEEEDSDFEEAETDNFFDEDAESEDEEDEDAEFEDDPESESEGGDEDGGAVANALRQAIRARLTAEKAAGSKTPQAVQVNIPTLEDLKSVEGLEEVHEDDLRTIHAIASAVVENAITSFNESAVAPMRVTASEEKRKHQIVANLNNFNKKFPKALDTHQDKMAVVWDEFSEEYGRDYADSISFEDLYIMAGGKGKKAASAKVDGVAKKMARDQKKQSVRSSRQAGRVAKVRAGGARKKARPDEDARRATERHIRKTNFTPFTIR